MSLIKRIQTNTNMYLHQELTGKIIGACINVHNELGCGFHEKVYQEALAIVLEESGIPFEREKHLPIEFHGVTTLQTSSLTMRLFWS